MLISYFDVLTTLKAKDCYMHVSDCYELLFILMFS